PPHPRPQVWPTQCFDLELTRGSQLPQQINEPTNLPVEDLSARRRRSVRVSNIPNLLRDAVHRIDDLEEEVRTLKFKLDLVEYRNRLITKEMERLLDGPQS